MCLSLSPSSPLLCLWKCTWKVGEIYSQLPTITGHAISYEISIQLWMQACYWPECLFKIWLIQLLTVHRANATKPKWKMYSSPWLASECIQLMVLAWNSVISSTCFPLWAWNTGCCIRRRLQVCVLAATRHLCVARHFSECPQQVHSRAPSPRSISGLRNGGRQTLLGKPVPKILPASLKHSQHSWNHPKVPSRHLKDVLCDNIWHLHNEQAIM